MLHSFQSPSRIHAGIGAHARVGEILAGFGSDRIFIVADAAVLGSEIFGLVDGVLRQQGIASAVFSGIAPDPSDTIVAEAIDGARAHGASALLALGGGSTIDVAKAVGIVATNGGRIHDYEGIDKFSVPPLPLIAIPTTAGTGSEVSGSCVITDSQRHLKMSIRHAALNPAKAAILDPLALKTMPAHVAMHSGMDAFVHAFESYISRKASPFTDALNLHALRLIARNLRPFVSNRGNLQAGLDMLVGSALAGMAFGLTGLGNVHCLARFVGTYFHLPHGLSNAVCLPHVADFNRIAAPEKYAAIADAFGADVRGVAPEVAARTAVAEIRAFCADLGVPARLRDVGADEAVFEEIADLCVEADYDRWNPRSTTRADFLALLRAAY
ncbi:iron-containing alcohol dehydrogenase [Aquabacter spiritensis]|uniref:Alcohol dehydrogenase 2 n=1 Tax=Aquabacter spiritensis TaxID=933073 RepID=A0A4V2UXV5_9HYPH|nr:iron-containing alcohol dehydrogenase [Aquabacter spiritensis]TCT04988.1 alcohol dehydrogenase [Aquabacter spiritensis]